MNWWSWIAHLGAAQGLILALAIVSVPHGNVRANRILAAFLCVESLRLLSLSYYYFDLHFWPGVPIYQLHHLSFAFGPLLYFYARCLVDRDFRWRPVYLWHFLPVVVAVVFFMPGFIVAEPMQQYNSYSELPPALKSRVSLYSLPVYISLGVYSGLALVLLRGHEVTIRSEFSSLHSIDLKWLQWLLWLSLISALITGCVELLQALGLVELHRRAVTSVLASVAVIYYIGLMGLRQPRIFEAEHVGGRRAAAAEAAAADAAGDTPEVKYLKSGLGEEDVERLWQKLTHEMKEEKLYLRAGLKLGELARLVGSRPDYLSQVINTKTSGNFYEFVNRYRIDEACRLLEADPQMRSNIADIAQESGFTSLNIFNRHFKRLRNTTPSAYRKALSASPGDGDPVG